MRVNTSWVCLWLGLGLLARAESTNRIRQVHLDPLGIVRIPVAVDRLTTISFPGPIAALEAAFVSKGEEPPNRFQAVFPAGGHYFSVRALVTNAVANINVVWEANVYVIELFESNEPALSVLCSKSLPSRPAPPINTLSPPAMLDLARNYHRLKPQHPETLAGIEFSQPNRALNYGDWQLTVAEAFQFEPPGVLVFHLLLQNRTATAIYYYPQTISLQLGQQYFYPIVIEANGVIPPSAVSDVYLALGAGPDGSRATLSAKDEFVLQLTRLVFANGTPPVLPAAQYYYNPNYSSKQGTWMYYRP